VLGTRATENGIARWEGIVLIKGNNSIKVESSRDGQTYTDFCVWVLDTGFGTRKIAQIYDVLQHINLMLFIGLLLILLLWYLSWKKIPKLSRWKRITVKIFFFTSLLAEIVLLLINIFIGSRLG
jgi:hypothetical protein